MMQLRLGRPTEAGPVRNTSTRLFSFAFPKDLASWQRVFTSVWLLVGLVVLGAALRIVPYAGNRSLWIDEAMLAHNLTTRSLPELLKPLDFDQAAPVGFLAVEWLVVRLLGPGEMALRLFPLLIGVAALPLVVLLARRYLHPMAVPIAVALFAVHPLLIYYSSELKPYGGDATWLLALYLAAGSTVSPRWTAGRLLGWAVLGAAAPWFSFPTVFVLAGLGPVWAVAVLYRRQWADLARVCGLGAVWLASFAVYYVVVLRAASANPFLVDYWSARFMPLPPFSLSGAGWFADTFFLFLKNPVGLSLMDNSLGGLGALLLLIGAAVFWKEKRPLFWLLAAPIPFALLASGLHKYPLGGRLVLFAVPLALLVLAEGAWRIFTATYRPMPLLAGLVLALLFIGPAGSEAKELLKPRRQEEVRPAVEQLALQWREGDRLYVGYGSWPGWLYYAPRSGLGSVEAVYGVKGRKDWRRYRADLEQLRGSRRVWFLFSHGDPDDERFIVTCLEEMGTGHKAIQAPGAAVYLYDLGG